MVRSNVEKRALLESQGTGQEETSVWKSLLIPSPKFTKKKGNQFSMGTWGEQGKDGVMQVEGMR